MGCAESHERHPHPRSLRPAASSSSLTDLNCADPTKLTPLLPHHSYTTDPAASLLDNDDMGGPSTARLASQHERLMLELLPFKDASQFQEWLASSYVRGSWAEFSRDFLSVGDNMHLPEPDKEASCKEASKAVNDKSNRFMVFHPDKTGWGPQEHAVRFIVTVASDSLLNKVWGWSEWKKRDLQICKAMYEVLSFLRSTVDEEHQMPPSYAAS